MALLKDGTRIFGTLNVNTEIVVSNTAILSTLNSAFNLANNTNTIAISGFDKANSANVIASGAFDKANSANIVASGAFDKANSANIVASGAFDKANSANVTASDAFDKANSANIVASGAFDKANSANIVASGAFDKANSANIVASGAFDKANSANVIASSAFDYSNSVNLIALGGFDKANSANVIASNAYDKANSANIVASSAFDKANSANVIASGAYDKANSANVVASSAFDKANSANVVASSAFDKANSANIVASSAFDKANSANVVASSAFDKANSANIVASSAFDKANLVNTISSSSFDKANVANVIASAAFDFANTRFSSNGGIIFGNLTVSGNLTISGDTVFNNVSTYQIQDPLIYLAANNYSADLVDIGFVANYVNTTGSNVHTGLIRDSGSKEYYLFHGYDKEPENNHIDVLGNNFTISVLNSTIRSSNIIINGINLYSWVESSYIQANVSSIAFNKANVANIIASGAFDKANSAIIVSSASFDKANAANIIGSSAFDKANSANIVASSAFDKANSVSIISSAAFDKANSANIVASSAFDKANSSNVVASAAFDKANSANIVASGAFDKANSANVIASGAFDKANSANIVASGAFDKANSANVIASAAFDKANSANVIASSAFLKANAANVIASGAFDKANSANVTASDSFDKANSANVIASAAFDKANSANVIASAAFDKANSANVLAFNTNTISSVAFDRANSANIVASSAFDKSNSANIIGSSAFDKANSANIVASSAFDKANSVSIISSAAFDQANSATDSAAAAIILGSSAFDKANSANIVASGAFDKANSAVQISFSTIVANGTSLVADSNADTLTILSSSNVAITADAAGDNMMFDLTMTGVTATTYGSSTIVPVFTVDSRGRLTSVTNTTISTTIASASFDKANGANVVASNAFDKANSANVISSSAFDKANGANVVASNAFDKANSANVISSSAFDKANSTNVTASAAFDKANSTNVTASAAFDKANLAAPIASPTFTGTVTVPSSLIVLKSGDPSEGGEINFEKSSGSNISGNLVTDLYDNRFRIFEQTGTNRGFFLDITKGNTGVGGEILHTNNWFNYISTSGSGGDIGPAFDKANSANIVASSAFDKANSANLAAVGAFDKANGAVQISFSTIVANGTSLVADSNADTLTIRTTGNVAITADAAGDNMTFDLTTTGVTASIYGSSTIVPVFTVDSRGRLTSVTNTTISTTIASAAFDKANGANLAAVGAFAKANGAAQLSFSTVIANGTSLVADSNADTLDIRTTGNVSIIGNATGDNMTFDLTTTGVTAATYGSNTIVPVFTVDSRGRLTSVTNTTISTTIASAAFDKANSANLAAVGAFAKANGAAQLSFSTVIANGTSLVADSNADTLTILTSGNVSIIGNATGDNMTFDLTTTGVTAATYGNSTIVPVFTVDARGRLTSVSNTIISTTAALAAFAKANGAAQLSFSTVIANGTSLVADSNADTLTVRTTGNVAITADATGDNITFDLTTTGVTAGVYGNSTIVPVISVDSRGRVITVSNVAITSGGGGTSTNSIVFISDTAPTNVANGTLWWNSDDGSLYIRYADSNSTQWVVTSSGGDGNGSTGGGSGGITTGKAIAMAIVFGG